MAAQQVLALLDGVRVSVSQPFLTEHWRHMDDSRFDYERGSYCDGYLQKDGEGFAGRLKVDRVDLSPIEGMYFKERDRLWLWLKRRPLLEYDTELGKYRERAREPRWEAYLEKVNKGVVAFEGIFAFLRFRYRLTGIWDDVLRDSRRRLNLFVERLPLSEQSIINAINERNRELQSVRLKGVGGGGGV